MDDHVVARELGRLTEAVESLQRMFEAGGDDHETLAKRVTRLENRHALVHGVVIAIGAVAGFLGLDRLSHLFQK